MKSTLKQPQVRTDRPAGPETTPRMPHERDESSDSQASPPREIIKQAYKDLQDGQVDTDLRETSGVDVVVNERPGTPPERILKKGTE